jgi:hypothetical protein
MKNRNKKRNIGFIRMPQVSIRAIPINSPEEREEIFRNLATSSEFDMRPSGVFEYYGKDFITYKRLDSSDKARNEFLRVIAKFMTECLEDNCPPSWKQCHPAFWEELIFTYYPHEMHFSPDNKESEKFIAQLLKFVRWLDKHVGTSWYPIVEEYSLIAFPDLQKCEKLLNFLVLRDFPRIHHEEFNSREDIEKFTKNYNQCPLKIDGFFEATSIIDDFIVLTNLETGRTYCVQGLPAALILPGMTFDGTIGKQNDDLYWHLYVSIGIYPQRGKKYIAYIPGNGPILKCLRSVDD